jgi:hypothetical protein
MELTQTQQEIKKVMRTELVDNRDYYSFDEGKWWGIVWFSEEDSMAMAFNSKRDAKWFITEGYQNFE